MSGRYFIEHGMWHDRKTGRHLEDIVSEVKPSERLLRLLETAADHDQTPEDARAELEADGVDVNAFLAKVHDDEVAWLRARAERVERRTSLNCRKCGLREVPPVDSTRLRALAAELTNFHGRRDGESETDMLRRQSRLGEVQAWLTITADRADGLCAFCGSDWHRSTGG